MKKIQRIAEIAPWAVGMLLALALFCDGLAKGGRWPLYQAIAMADRWGTLSFGYSQGTVDGFMPSTPYFPGVSFLAIVARRLTPEHDLMLLLALASLSVPVLLIALASVYNRLGGRLSIGGFVAVASTLALVALPDWLGHANELKPDTLALIAFVVAWLALDQPATAYRWRYPVVGLCVALAIVLKQQSIMLVLGLTIGMGLRDWRLGLIGPGWLAVTIGTIGGLSAALLVPGAWRFTILAHSGRPVIWEFQLGQLRFLIVSVVIIALIIIMRNSQPHPSPMQTFSGGKVSPVPSALLWVIAGILGALNFGGNLSNVQSGLVLTLPWIVLALERLPTILLRVCWGVAAALMIGYLIIGDWQMRAESRMSADNEVRALVRSMPASEVLASGASYLAVRSITGVKVHEIDTWAHYHHGRLKNEVPTNSALLMQNLEADIIICMEGCSLQARLYNFLPSQLGYEPIDKSKPSLMGKVFLRSQI
jgi:hypothetical protein